MALCSISPSLEAAKAERALPHCFPQRQLKLTELSEIEPATVTGRYGLHLRPELIDRNVPATAA
eukprot:3052671-Pleurochrysis_carterae.AAC.4